MNIAYQNLTNSSETIKEIGTKLVNTRIQVPIFVRNFIKKLPPALMAKYSYYFAFF